MIQTVEVDASPKPERMRFNDERRWAHGLVGQAEDSEALSVGKLFHSFMDGAEPQDELEPTMKAWGMAKAAEEVFGAV